MIETAVCEIGNQAKNLLINLFIQNQALSI